MWRDEMTQGVGMGPSTCSANHVLLGTLNQIPFQSVARANEAHGGPTCRDIGDPTIKF